jgi:hypothetical protein
MGRIDNFIVGLFNRVIKCNIFSELLALTEMIQKVFVKLVYVK